MKRKIAIVVLSALIISLTLEAVFVGMGMHEKSQTSQTLDSILIAIFFGNVLIDVKRGQKL